MSEEKQKNEEQVVSEKQQKKGLKRWIVAIVVLMFMAFLGAMGYRSYIDYYYTMPFNLKQEEFTFEYGSEIPTDIRDYIDIIDEKKFKEEDVLMNNTSDVMKIGTYDCSIDWRKTSVDFKIVVKDTQPPEIKVEKENIKIKYAEEYDVLDNVEYAVDIIDGKLEYKVEGTLDNKKSGEQKFKVVAIDSNGNKSTKDFVVNVGKKPAWPKEYSDETCSITITKEKYKNAWCYIAHLKFSDYDRFGSAIANNKRGSYETTSHAAKRLNAIFCVNGPYNWGELANAYAIVRSGKVVHNKSIEADLGIYNANTGKLANAGDLGLAGRSASSAANAGKVTDTFKFWNSTLVKNGRNVSNANNYDRAQRTFIATNGKPGDIYIVCAEGRYADGASPGLTKYECAKVVQDLGCTYGVMLDGGGSTTMYFDGKVLNSVAGNERAVADFVYFK